MQLALGLDINAMATPRGDALIDLDFAHGRYAFAGKAYASAAAFLAAAGGAAVGSAMVIGPHVVGSELIPGGSFDGGSLDGWASTPAHAENGSVSVVSNRLVATINSPAGSYRAARANSVIIGRAYRYAAAFVAKGATPPLNAMSINASTNADLGGSDLRFGDLGAALPQALEVVAGTAATTLHTGFVAAVTANVAATLSLDNFSLREVLPYPGYSPAGFAFQLSATTPAAASGDKVALQWGTDGERYRVRLVWDANRHLRLIVTVWGGEQANLDLGVVEVSTAFDVTASIGPNRILARLAGSSTIADLGCAIPSIGRLWIGRSYTGEAWDGTLEALQVWVGERVPTDTILIEGDSYSAGAGEATLGGALPVALPGRAVISTAVGGSTPSGILSRLGAVPGLARGAVVIWDGDMNTGAVVADQLAAYAQIVARLGHGRYLILPPCRRAAKSAGDNANVATLQAALAATYPGNVLDAQAILAAHATSPGDDADLAAGYIPTSLLQADQVHLTATAMAHVAAGVAGEIAARGW